VPVLGDRGCSSEVRLDHVNEPRLVRGKTVPVAEPLEIGEQKAALAGQLRDTAVECVQASSQLDRRQPRETELAASDGVVAVARVVNGIDEVRPPSGCSRCVIWSSRRRIARGDSPPSRSLPPAVSVTTSALVGARARSASTPCVVLPSRVRSTRSKPNLRPSCDAAPPRGRPRESCAANYLRVTFPHAGPAGAPC
jgi:hypothetical protein